MADVRAYPGVPTLNSFGGIVTPTPSTPLIVDSTTGDLYVLINEVVTKAAIGIGAAAGLTATGSNQGTALSLTKALNEVTTVSAGTGVILTAGEQTVYNGGANVLKVYPSASAAINQLAVNAPILLPPATAATFQKLSATKWIGSRSA